MITATDGEKAFEQQAPYIALDQGTHWLVKGTKSRLPPVLTPNEADMNKADATVIRYGMTIPYVGISPPLRP